MLLEGVYRHLDDLYVCVCNEIGLSVQGPSLFLRICSLHLFELLRSFSYMIWIDV